MRGSIQRRYAGSYSLIIDLGLQPDAAGALKRKQKCITFRGTRQAAEKELTRLLGTADSGTFVEPSKVTLGAWLRDLARLHR